MLTSVKVRAQFALVAAAAIGIGGVAAHASIVNYSNVTDAVTGITISNISENNNDNFTAGHYGQPTFVGGFLKFPSLNNFSSTSFTGQTNSLTDVLTFTVTMPNNTSLNPLLNLSEGGIFQGFGGGLGTITLGVVVTDINGTVIPINGGAGSITPSIPFTAPGNTATTFTWSGSISPSSSGKLTQYIVHLDNDLFTAAPAGQSPSFAFLDKKALTINFCPDCSGATPEPASLGVLGLGGMALLVRRRK